MKYTRSYSYGNVGTFFWATRYSQSVMHSAPSQAEVYLHLCVCEHTCSWRQSMAGLSKAHLTTKYRRAEETGRVLDTS